MAKITILVDGNEVAGGTYDAPADAQFALEARLDSGSASGWEWTKDVGGKKTKLASNPVQINMASGGAGTYTASATLTDPDDATKKISETSAPVTVGVKSAKPAVTDPAPAPEPRAYFHKVFAGIAAFALLALLIWVVIVIDPYDFGVSGDEWKDLDARGRMGARVIVSVLMVGIATLFVGIWMAVVRWRGEMDPKPAADGQNKTRGATDIGSQVAAVVDSVGKLKGATAVMVIGALLLLSAMWVTNSAVDAPEMTDTPPTTPTAEPSETPAPEPSATDVPDSGE